MKQVSQPKVQVFHLFFNFSLALGPPLIHSGLSNSVSTPQKANSLQITILQNRGVLNPSYWAGYEHALKTQMTNYQEVTNQWRAHPFGTVINVTERVKRRKGA